MPRHISLRPPEVADAMALSATALRNIILVLLVGQTVTIVLLMHYSRTVVRTESEGPLYRGVAPPCGRPPYSRSCFACARSSIRAHTAAVRAPGFQAAALLDHDSVGDGRRAPDAPHATHRGPRHGLERHTQVQRAGAVLHDPEQPALCRALPPRPAHLPGLLPDKDADDRRVCVPAALEATRRVAVGGGRVARRRRARPTAAVCVCTASAAAYRIPSSRAIGRHAATLAINPHVRRRHRAR
eukprot:3239408-Prymnesium_polylepis.1